MKLAEIVARDSFTGGTVTTGTTTAFAVALVLGLIELGRSRAQSLVAWAVVLLAIGLLWGVLR